MFAKLDAHNLLRAYMCPHDTMRRHKLNLFPAGMYKRGVASGARARARVHHPRRDLHPSARHRLPRGFDSEYSWRRRRIGQSEDASMYEVGCFTAGAGSVQGKGGRRLARVKE